MQADINMHVILDICCEIDDGDQISSWYGFSL